MTPGQNVTIMVMRPLRERGHPSFTVWDSSDRFIRNERACTMLSGALLFGAPPHPYPLGRGAFMKPIPTAAFVMAVASIVVACGTDAPTSSTTPPDPQEDASGVDLDSVTLGDGAQDTSVHTELPAADQARQNPTPEPIGPAQSCLEDVDVIVPTPDAFPDYRAWGFNRYAEWRAPNGKPIRIFAADAVSDVMIYRVRNVLRFFLSDVPGSQYGSNKSAAANRMADNGAVLMLPAGAHEEGNEPPFNAQPLYEEEIAVEGSDWYLNVDWDHRDATFEEIFHLVHDTGIGTVFPGALPDYQRALLAEAKAAIADGRWGIAVDPFVSDWLAELEAENSLAQEYIAAVIDSYYGYWGAFTEAPGGMWGIYIAKTRAEVTAKDPKGLALLEAFLPAMAHYEARLDPGFSGTFFMRFEPSKAYTHRSQYLTAVTLTGANPSSVIGNAADNHLRGNIADNTLDGGAGRDTVIYCEPRTAYRVTDQGDHWRIVGPDGTDVLRDIEAFHFSDGLYSAETLGP